MLPGRDPSRIRPGPERSVPAAPGGELLVAVQRRAERADGVGADPGGLVAGQGFELFAHPQVVALVDEGHLVGHRNAYFAALLAAGRGGGHPLHRLGAGRHVYPGATGQAKDGGGAGGKRQEAHWTTPGGAGTRHCGRAGLHATSQREPGRWLERGETRREKRRVGKEWVRKGRSRG